MTTDLREYPIFSAATRADPQAVYEQMRQNDPIYAAQGPQTGYTFWFITRYDDVIAVLKDQRFIKDSNKNLPPEHARRFGLPEEEQGIWAAINRHMLNLDPPDHTRLRSLVHKAFTPKRVRDLEPRIHAIAKDLLDAMEGKSEGDLIEDFAYPLPITVIAEMLGVDADMRDKFREWTKIILFSGTEESSMAAVMEFVQYINELIEARREEDKGDILSALIRANEDGDSLSHIELLSMIFLLLVAGHETTVNLIGNGMLALMQNPDQLDLLKQDPTLIKTAVEEILRFNGPVETTTWRIASEDIEVNGVTIPLGDVVLPSLLAANRDPSIFENPNKFDITRDPNPHVAFGHGIHYCVGAPLARMEGQIAINALVQRFPNIRLNTDVDKLKWNHSLLLHGMEGLPVAYP